MREIGEEHVVSSFPMNLVKGVGYVLKSGTVGIYYQNLDNVYIKSNSITIIQIKMDGGKKIFAVEEHQISTADPTVQQHIKNIRYFVVNFTQLQWSCMKLPLKSPIASKEVFVAKVKRIRDGFLFIMTNNIFIFDFNFGEKVVIASDGRSVNVLDEEGRSISLTDFTKENILNELKQYIQ